MSLSSSYVSLSGGLRLWNDVEEEELVEGENEKGGKERVRDCGTRTET